MNQARAMRLYYGAVCKRLMGNSAAAARLCRAALECGEPRKARGFLARLELPGEDYFRVLKRLHAHLRPRTYIEIGVWKGKSLRLALPATRVLAIDPAPRLKKPPTPNVRVFAESSDDFFTQRNVLAELGGERVHLAFIDGMHRFEYALRDFIHLERLARPDTVILLHDCYPLDTRSAERERTTEFWSGDIWRLIVLLKKYRPDLALHTLATPPTGLGMVFNLDPGSTVLERNCERLIAEGLELQFPLDGRKPELLNLFPNDWRKIRGLLDARRSGRALAEPV